MNYNEILRRIADRENVSINDVENEMVEAIGRAGLDCTVEEFIDTVARMVMQRRYIV